MEHFLGDIELRNPIFVFLYFLPTLVGLLRQRMAPNRHIPIGVVFFLDLCFAWTIIGWIVAMVLACRGDDVVSDASEPAPPTGWQPLPQIWGSQDWQPQQMEPQQQPPQNWTSAEPAGPCPRCNDHGETCPICWGNRGKYELPTGENGVSVWIPCTRCCSSGRIQCTLCGKTG